MSQGLVLLFQPSLNLGAFSSVLEATLDKNPLRQAAGTPGSLQHFISTLAHFRDVPHNAVEDMVHVGFLIGADERDLPEILEVLSLPHLTRETKQRGINLAIVTGSIADFKRALTRDDVSTSTKDILTRIKSELSTVLRLQ